MQHSSQTQNELEMDCWLHLQADLCRLPQNLVQFDAVLAANVIERLADPALFLDRLAGLVKASGVVVLASAFSWSEHDTPRDCWLGGFYKVTCCVLPFTPSQY